MSRIQKKIVSSTVTPGSNYTAQLKYNHKSRIVDLNI